MRSAATLTVVVVAMWEEIMVLLLSLRILLISLLSMKRLTYHP
jgi:hypothetical protein